MQEKMMKGFSDKYVESLIKKTIRGSMTSRQAALKLGITRQYMNRLKARYLTEGISCLSHGNAGKHRDWRIPDEISARIIALYRDRYQGFNFRHFLEKLNEVELIEISYGALYRILSEAGIQSPKCQRYRKKDNIHPIRPRRECFGELLQTDASLHKWFGESFPKATLHGSVDDSTGTVMGLYFDKEETLWGYYNMLRQILLKYGIPEAFYADNRSIFELRKLSEKNQTIDRDVHIQFKRCCSQLGIELITTSTPQAKGRIERLWGSLQSRLISELALKGITDIESANAFLPEFMDDYNRRFASEPDPENCLFVPTPGEQEINYYLSIQYERIIDNGSSFSFFGSRLQLVDTRGKVIRISKGMKIDVYKTFDNCIVAVYDGRFFETKEAVADAKRPDEKPDLEKKVWKPSPCHPWRRYVTARKQESAGN